MEISAATTSATAIDSSAAARSSATLAENFDTFLGLLTAQLRHQDPLEPLDSKEFTNQLVSFSGVEQAIATNTNLERLVELVLAGQSGNLVNYLGKMAEVASDVTALKDGQAAWSYRLDAPAASAKLLVFDQNQRIVYVGEGATAQGANEFTWNGQDNSGRALPEGSYQLGVAALDADGKPIGKRITTRGLVSSVETVDGQQLLTVGGAKIPLSDVLSVSVAEAI